MADVVTKRTITKDIQDVINIIYELAQMQVENDNTGTDYDPMAIPYLCGKPGGGKTAALNHKFTEMGWGMVSCHLALKSIEELSGIPNFKEVPDDDDPTITHLGTEWSIPDIITAIKTVQNNMIKKVKLENNGNLPKDYKPYCVLFMDDLHLAAPHHMALMFQLLTEKRIKDAQLPKYSAIILAGNHKSSKSGGRNMFAAIANRVAFLPVETSFDSWCDNYGFNAGINSAILGFLKSDSKAESFFHEDEMMDEAWASPRSWTYLSKLLNKYENKGIPIGDSLLSYMANAIIGERAATNFIIFYKLYSKFDMEKQFALKDKVKLPHERNELYAFAFAAISYYMKKYKKTKGESNRQFVDDNIINGMAHILGKYVDSNKDLVSVMLQIANKDKIAYTKLSTELRTKIPGFENSGLTSFFSNKAEVINQTM